MHEALVSILSGEAAEAERRQEYDNLLGDDYAEQHWLTRSARFGSAVLLNSLFSFVKNLDAMVEGVDINNNTLTPGQRALVGTIGAIEAVLMAAPPGKLLGAAAARLGILKVVSPAVARVMSVDLTKRLTQPVAQRLTQSAAGQGFLKAFAKVYNSKYTANGIRKVAPRSGATWTRPPNWQGPAASKGTWFGQEGNSVFKLNNATADAFGVPRGTQVRFVEGVPDFSPFVRPTPAGTSGVFEVPRLTGVHATDQQLIRAFLADQAGTSQAAVTRYLRANDLRMHHFSRNTVQLVPDNIHQLHHTGGAAALRGLQ